MKFQMLKSTRVSLELMLMCLWLERKRKVSVLRSKTLLVLRMSREPSSMSIAAISGCSKKEKKLKLKLDDLMQILE